MPTMNETFDVPDAQHYSYRVLWSPDDNEFIALVAEFPSLSWLAPNQDDALNGAVALVADIIKDMYAHGETIPKPLSERTYTGKFMVRTSSELHARLVREAAEQGVSMNQLANQRLSGH
jgi:predicted HicB family RNase H-like nuclease